MLKIESDPDNNEVNKDTSVDFGGHYIIFLMNIKGKVS